MSDIYLVEARAGSYDSFREWVIAAFPNQYEAETFSSRLTSTLADYVADHGSDGLHYGDDREALQQHFLDAGFPEGTIPYGDLEDLAFSFYGVPFFTDG